MTAQWAYWVGRVAELGPEDGDHVHRYAEILTSGEPDLREQAISVAAILHEVLAERRGWRRRVTD